jgi:homoserine kinase
MYSSSTSAFPPAPDTHRRVLEALKPYQTEDKTCSVAVPATSANLGVGFDTLGMALGLWNYFIFERLEADTIPRLRTLPHSCFPLGSRTGWEAVRQNICFEALHCFYQAIQLPMPPYDVQVQVNVPVARGLGSSATAVVAALMAANRFEGFPMSEQALLELAIRFEGHPDNVAPAFTGGCIVGNMSQACALPWPEHWYSAVWIPEDAMLTEAARHVLPHRVSMPEAVQAMQRIALCIHAIHTQNATLLKQVFEQDALHEPYRGPLIQGFTTLRERMNTAGCALGTLISGSGSTVLTVFEAPYQLEVMDVLTTWKEEWGGEALALNLELQGAFYF